MTSAGSGLLAGLAAGLVAAAILWVEPSSRRFSGLGHVGRARRLGLDSASLRFRLADGLARADVSWPVDAALRVWRRSILAAMVVSALFGSVSTTLISVAVATAGPIVFLSARGDRRRRREVRELPAAIDVIERSLRSGVGLRDAIAEAALAVPALSPGFGSVVARAVAGQPLVHALNDWALDLADPDAELLVAVVEMGERTGGSISPSLARVAQTIRDRRELIDETAALSAQTRLSALVVAAAPLGFAAFMSVIDPGAATMLLTTPIGRLCLVAGLLLDGIGIWWMKRLARKVQP